MRPHSPNTDNSLTVEGLETSTSDERPRKRGQGVGGLVLEKTELGRIDGMDPVSFVSYNDLLKGYRPFRITVVNEE